MKEVINILSKYRPVASKTLIFEVNGDYLVSNILCEELSYEDQTKLVELGWGGADDWIGLELNS